MPSLMPVDSTHQIFSSFIGQTCTILDRSTRSHVILLLRWRLLTRLHIPLQNSCRLLQDSCRLLQNTRPPPSLALKFVVWRALEPLHNCLHHPAKPVEVQGVQGDVTYEIRRCQPDGYRSCPGPRKSH